MESKSRDMRAVGGLSKMYLVMVDSSLRLVAFEGGVGRKVADGEDHPETPMPEPTA